MSRIRNAWSALRGKALPPLQAGTTYSFGFGGGTGTNARTAREALASYKTMPRVRSVVGKISGAVAATEWQAFARRKAGKAVKWSRATSRDKSIRDAERKASGDDANKPLVSHPLLDLLDRPNGVMSGAELFALTETHLEAKGEAFWLKERNGAGMPIELWPVPPHWMAETPLLPGQTFRVSWKGWEQRIPFEDVVWFRDLDPENPYGRGVGIIETLADELDTDEAAAKQVSAFFKNQGLPGAIVSAEGASEPELQRAKDKMESDHRGWWNAFRVYWTSKKLSVARLDTSFKDMDLVALREFLRDMVVSGFGVPPELVGILENSNRSTIEAAKFLFAEGVIVPRLERLRLGLQMHLVPDFDERLLLEYVSPVPEDREFALKVMEVRPGDFTANEARKLAAHAPVKGGDDLAPVAVPALPPGKGADPPWTVAIKAPPPPPPPPPPGDSSARPLTEDEVDNVLERLRAERLTDELDPVWDERVGEWAKDVLDELGASAQFTLLNPLVAEHLKDFAGDRIKGLVNETTKAQLRETLIEGIRAGEDGRAMRNRVLDLFDNISDSRAENIARTESLRSSNWATTEAYRVSGVVQRRKWVATPDGRTRDSHRALNGKVVGINERFRIGDDEGDHPGAFGKAENSCNCRCTTTAVIDEPKSADDLDAVWKRYDDRLRGWDEAAAAAVRRGFRKQARDILKALGEA